jgi:hypothetical protein
MYFTHNFSSLQIAFELLIDETTKTLHKRVIDGTVNKSHLSTKLEVIVHETMEDLAKGTIFENQIELISGQRFPDIVVHKVFGIEVKSTKQAHWTTTGNSVFEGTRVDGVEKIYMLFGKMAEPIEFKYRPYEDCLVDIAITHSPRYRIDMNLKQGDTIFDKIEIPYNDLRNSASPIKPIVAYYKEKVLKPGEELWWINQDEDQEALGTNPIIRMWSSLSTREKNNYKLKSMAFFPLMFGGSQDKFEKLAFWLITSESIVCTSLRDLFTSGGKKTIKIGSTTFIDAPRILYNLDSSFEDVITILNETSHTILNEHWKIGHSLTDKNKIDMWLVLTSMYLSEFITKYSQSDLYDSLSQRYASINTELFN